MNVKLDESQQIIATVEVPALLSSIVTPSQLLELLVQRLSWLKDASGRSGAVVHPGDNLPSWWPSDFRDGDYFVEVWSCDDRTVDTSAVEDVPAGVSVVVRVHPSMHCDVGPAPGPGPGPAPGGGPCDGPMSSASAVPLVAAAWMDVAGEQPSPALMLCLLAQFRHESGYARPRKPPQWTGSCNWGAVSGEGPAGSFEWRDLNPNTGKTVSRRFKRYHNDHEGLVDAMRFVHSCHVPSVPASAYDYARPLRACGYYGTTTGQDHTLRSASKADQVRDALAYAEALHSHFPAIRAQVPALPDLPLGTPSSSATNESVSTVALAGVGLLLGAALVRAMRGGRG